MAIIIQNIDKNPREKGEHLYQLRINNQVICEFTHYREDSLSTCLMRAAAAAGSERSEELKSKDGLKNDGYDPSSPNGYD